MPKIGASCGAPTAHPLINNGQRAGSVDLGTHPGGFQIAGVGDFNGDGTKDVLWHSA